MPERMKFKGIVYLAGPYRGESMNAVYEHINTARSAAVELWKRGYVVICPHMNTAFMDGVGTDEMFLQGDIEILKRCDLVVMLPGYENSRGAVEERNVALIEQIPVRKYYELIMSEPEV